MEMAKRSKTEVGTKQLTPREFAFAVNVLQGTSITEAARRVGYPEKDLSQSGNQAPQAIRLSAPVLMDRLGLTERVLIEEHLAPLLAATTTKYFQAEGGVRQRREVANVYARLKALDMAFKLRGSYATADSKLAKPAPPPAIIIDIPWAGHPPDAAPTDNAMNNGQSATG
jgi:hypothetical protein